MGLMLLCFNACELTKELDDYEPPYALDADVTINSESNADLALIGAYSKFRYQPYAGTNPSPDIFVVPDLMSGYAQSSASIGARPEMAAFINNNPISVGASITSDFYSGMYELVNRANWIIEKVSELDASVFETPGRKDEIVGEAIILRALSHFYLLRCFGQFYDMGSAYGIDIRTAPVLDVEPHPRKTVAESYAAILSDLDEGITNAPDLRGKNYVNKTFAKGIKAKVLLYMGSYAESAALAKDIIDHADGNFQLESNYLDIFMDHSSPDIFNSPEVLFGSSGTPEESVGIGSRYAGSFAPINQKYMDEASGSIDVNGQVIDYDGNDRVLAILQPNVIVTGAYATSKYAPVYTAGYEMIYHMRMAEVYLILAEASVRTNESVTTEALDALNAIRLRAGATTTGGDGFETYPATIPYEQFLTAVRMEKLMELQAELGETWYDMVRYDYADGFGSGFQVSDVKITATDPDKFILPIPQESVDASGGIIVQNPSYE